MESFEQPDAKNHLWAPWRMEYLERLDELQTGCFLCRDRDETHRDAEHLVVWRGKRVFSVLNRFPYTGGHCLIAPYEHVAGLDDLDSETMLELMTMARDLQVALRHAIHAEGFNVGMNLGRCAGAGLPGHLHMHIVPRWGGDTNFMPVLGDVRVIPEFLKQTREKILQAGVALSLPSASEGQ